MEVLKDYSWLRGVNHYICDEATTRQQLSYGKRVNLNSIRIWLVAEEWAENPKGFCDELRNYIRICYDCGYTVMPILLNGNRFKTEYVEEENMKFLDEYVTYVVNEIKDEEGLLMWDIMNEPSYNPWLLEKGISEEELNYRTERIWDFVRHYCKLVKELDPKTATTVGHTRGYEIEYTADDVDVFSFHDYSSTKAKCMNNYATADALSKKYGKPVIQTETGCLARCNPYDMALEVCEHFNMGWMLFELMIHDRCDTEHGIFYPDGTVRDPATIAAMFGCYRNRGESIIVPLPNREGAANNCVNAIKKALSEYTEDCFDYRRSNADELLNVCEKAANLLECCDMIPMAYPPTAKINRYRAMENPPIDEIRVLAFELAKTLKEICQIL